MRISNAKKLAALLHPAKQQVMIEDIQAFNETTKLYVLRSVCNGNKDSIGSGENTELAYFQAGSYIPVFVEIDGNVIERPYSLCSSPREALDGIYRIVVKGVDDGYISGHIIRNWKVGDTVTLGSPKEAESYNELRDNRNVIALAGGVGITPFHSMAKAIAEGDSDHSLTIFYGANTLGELLFAEEWKELEEKTHGKVRMVPVIANEEAEGCEHGFITMEILRKYIDPADASFFISGPPAMIRAMKKMLEPLQLPRKAIRISMNGDGGFHHAEGPSDTKKLTIRMGGETYTTTASTTETILTAIEKAGLKPAVYCRSGVCGFCRAMVVSGEFELACDETGVRAMDKHFGFIHPCCSYPRSDMEIVVQRAK